MRILQYKAGSRSARALSSALNCGRINREGSKFRNNYNHTIINWGCSTFDRAFPVTKWINTPEAVAMASNKLSSFIRLKEVIPDNIPEFTTEESVAQRWYLDEIRVVGRFNLTGHSGIGILITDTLDYPMSEGGMDVIKMREIKRRVAPLYVKYIKKTNEYRVHVINGEVVDVQQKRKRQSTSNDEVNYQVRNSASGWVYCRDNVSISSSARTLACRAVAAMRLDFGAVDLIYNSHEDKYYVLEINTACGMENTTVDIYANGLRRVISGR